MSQSKLETLIASRIARPPLYSATYTRVRYVLQLTGIELKGARVVSINQPLSACVLG
jgi:hypothetical protein